MKPIYLDNNATTACDPEVLEAMLPFFQQQFGNPHSPHVMGRKAMHHVEKARESVAAGLGCEPDEILFTAGATESNNIALFGLAKGILNDRKRILVCATEHKSVLYPCEELAANGFVVEKIPVNSQGEIRLDVLQQQLSTDTLVVSVHAANNEVGTIQPLAAVSQLVHERGALLHTDAAQACGKMPLKFSDLGVDLASISAHKLYGPKGIGALFVRRGLSPGVMRTVIQGGGQERGLRPGTLNVAGIVGMGVAFALAEVRLHQDVRHIADLRDAFEHKIEVVLECYFNGHGAQRLSGTTSITFPGVPADMLIANVPELCIGMGSACSSGTLSPSHVLLAMGLCREDAGCTIRVSFGRTNSQRDVQIAADLIGRAVSSLRTEASNRVQI